MVDFAESSSRERGSVKRSRREEEGVATSSSAADGGSGGGRELGAAGFFCLVSFAGELLTAGCSEAISLAGGLGWIGLVPVSRRTPRRNSLPSLRQFLAIAENCSMYHFTESLDPTMIGFLRRIQAPDGDVSSSVAEARLGAPV